LETVYANDFSKNDEAADSVRALQDSLSKCYASRVKQNQFAGTGLLILKAEVGHDGKMTGVSTVHSEVRDKNIEECAKTALKTWKYPQTQSEHRPRTITINIQYSLRDE